MTTFKVIVGPETNRRKLRFYRDVMMQRSEFFRTARSYWWIKDDPAKPTHLEDEDPEVFEAYVRAVLFDRIRIQGLGLDESGLFESNAAMEEEFAQHCDTTVEGVIFDLKVNRRFLGLMKLYALANMLIDHKITNMIIDETIRTFELTKTIPTTDSVQVVYSSTVSGDGMRNLLGGLFADGATKEMSQKGWPDEFMRDLAVTLLKHKELGMLKRERIFTPASYIAGWVPGDRKHLFCSGPGTDGYKLPGSDDEDFDYEPSDSEGEAVMTDDEMIE